MSVVEGELKKQEAVFKALASENRLLIVRLLSDEPRSVSYLTEQLGIDISTVSRHLSVLKNVGIVSAEREQTTMFYSLEMPCVLNFFNCVDEVIEARN
jgi:ArsR family transcriptional regulator